MRFLPGSRRLFRLLGREAPVEQEIDAEIAFHLDAEVEALVARGMDRDAARAEAQRRFGQVEETRAELARIDRGRRMKERRVSRLEDLGQDLGYAFRGFRRQPGFAGLIVLILGLGIGANATMFGLVDRLLLRPPARVVDAARVARFQLSESEPGMGSWTNESVAWLTFTDQRDHAAYSSLIAPYFTWSDAPLGRGEGAAKVRAVLATPEYFKLLGVDLTAVDLWCPFHAGALDVGGDGKGRDPYNWQWIKVLARLKPGVTRAQASDEATRIQRAAVAQVPETDHAARAALGARPGVQGGA